MIENTTLNYTNDSIYRKTLYPNKGISKTGSPTYQDCHDSLYDSKGPLILPYSVSDVSTTDRRRRKHKKKMVHEHRKRQAGILLGALKTTIILITIVLTWLIYQNGDTLMPIMKGTITDLDELGWKAAFIFAGIYSIWTTLLLPGEFLVLASGYVFTSCLPTTPLVAQLAAVVSCMCGLMIGGSIVFCLTRHYFWDRFWKRIKGNPVIESFIMVFEDGGLWYLILFRASPLVPFAVSNVILGLTNLSYGEWCLGLLGCIPSLVLSVHIGSKFNRIDDIFHTDTKNWLKIAVPVIPAVFCVVVAYVLVKKRLKIQQAKMGLLKPTKGVHKKKKRHKKAKLVL